MAISLAIVEVALAIQVPTYRSQSKVQYFLYPAAIGTQWGYHLLDLHSDLEGQCTTFSVLVHK